MNVSPPSGVVDLAGEVETLSETLSNLIGEIDLPPQVAETLQALIDASRKLAANARELDAKFEGLEAQAAQMAAVIAALSTRNAQLERIAFGSQSEKSGQNADPADDDTESDESTDTKSDDATSDESADTESNDTGSDDNADGNDNATDKPRGGKPGRKKDRGDAVNDSGLRFNKKAPVININMMPPEVAGLSPDQYEVIDERTHCRIAALDFRYIVLCYHYYTVKLLETETLASAPAVEGVFKNSYADVSFIVSMLIDKFFWHLPLYRQHRMLALSGITINRGTLSLWANRAIALLEPIHEALWRSVLESDVIQMDETPIRAGRNPGAPGSMNKGYLWPILGERKEIVFPFANNRRHENVPEFLGDYEGKVVSDGYGAYDAYEELCEGRVILQNCWTHTRRNFWEQKDASPDMANEMIQMIAELYAIEDEIRFLPDADRLKARQTRSRAVIDRIWAWCDEKLEDPALTPKHPIRKAIQYAVERKTRLEVFLSDPNVPLDTNLIENKIRYPKLGQRNWLFAWTELGAKNAGIMYGLLLTCEMHGVNPRVWLTDVLLRIASHPAHRVDELIPRRWKTLFADNPMTSDITSPFPSSCGDGGTDIAFATAQDGDVDPLEQG